MPLTPIPSGRQPIELGSYISSLAKPDKPTFLIVYASRDDNGRMWCGDCRDAEELIEKKFGDGSGRQLLVAYAGNKEEWNDSSNAYRKEPYLVKALPTLIKIHGDGKWDQLVEEDVYNEKKLDAFVDS